MEGRERAELKNRVLRFLLKNDRDYRPKAIYRSLNSPVKFLEHFIELLEEMCQEASKYFDCDVRDDGSIWVLKQNEFTLEFLEAGGFINQYESDLEAVQEMNRLAVQEERFKGLEEKNLLLGNRLAEQKLKTHWIPITISLIGLGVAIASYFRPSDNVTREELNQELQKVQDTIQQLKTDFKNENEELKERVYEAEMLIAVYEDSLS